MRPKQVLALRNLKQINLSGLEYVQTQKSGRFRGKSPALLIGILVEGARLKRDDFAETATITRQQNKRCQRGTQTDERNYEVHRRGINSVLNTKYANPFPPPSFFLWSHLLECANSYNFRRRWYFPACATNVSPSGRVTCAVVLAGTTKSHVHSPSTIFHELSMRPCSES